MRSVATTTRILTKTSRQITRKEYVKEVLTDRLNRRTTKTMIAKHLKYSRYHYAVHYIKI